MPGRVARGSSAPAGQRLASTVRLPWFVGLGALLVLGVVCGLLAGRGGTQAGVQRAVLDAQEATAVGAAQQVRRSLNEGVADLVQVAQALDEVLPADAVRSDRAATVLRATAEQHPRYTALALVDAATGRSVLPTPGEQPPAPLGRLDDTGSRTLALDDGRIVQSTPVREGSGLLVAAVYDPAFLLPDLLPAPRGSYVVDDRGLALTAPGGLGLGQALPNAVLRDAAELTGKVSGARAFRAGPGLASVVAHAPVEGFGPAGDAGLGLVVVRDVSATESMGSYRLQGVLAALLLVGTVLLLFRWLHSAVVGPLLALQREAERIAYGDLSRPVQVGRYDEIGRTARALERLRLALIRAEVQDLDVERSIR
jgi:HAMP domain-containing protein